MIATVIAFLKETRAELSRVQWLTREQTLRYTWLVIFISVLVAVFLGGLDYLFGGIVQNVLR
ncbi:MAG TPA: preprotein translocase subunit SecE [Patescibacteria group bacterium]|nr:preprotein translocase subunit SecE [Patescibacteria group bacterium]